MGGRDLQQRAGFDLADTTDDAVRKRAVESPQVPSDIHPISGLHGVAVADRQRGKVGSRDLDHHQIPFAVLRRHVPKRVPGLLARETHVSRRRAFDDVKAAGDQPVTDKEADAGAQRLTVRVLHGEKHRGSQGGPGNLPGSLGTDHARSEDCECDRQPHP